MGIKNLNKLIHSTTTYTGIFKTVIIDGTNYIIRRISKHFSNMLLNNKISSWNSINICLIDQTKFLINNTSYDIINLIKNINKKYKTEQIIFILDPITSPLHLLLTDVIVDLQVKLFDINTPNNKSNNIISLNLKEDERLNNKSNNIISLNLKEDERCRRRKQNDRTKNINDIIEQIKMDEENEDICNIKLEIYKQTDYYNNKRNQAKLLSCIMNEVLEHFNQKETFTNKSNIRLYNKTIQVQFIQAIHEADLVIKNIASYFNYDTVLIMSADSDYYVLVADLYNVYKSDIE
jgi:hypothetical protein